MWSYGDVVERVPARADGQTRSRFVHGTQPTSGRWSGASASATVMHGPGPAHTAITGPPRLRHRPPSDGRNDISPRVPPWPSHRGCRGHRPAAALDGDGGRCSGGRAFASQWPRAMPALLSRHVTTPGAHLVNCYRRRADRPDPARPVPDAVQPGRGDPAGTFTLANATTNGW